MTNHEGTPFNTQEAILAFCLLSAGCQPTMPACLNLYDADILFKLGGGEKDVNGKVIHNSRYAGMSLWDAANAAWEKKEKGHVEYGILLSKRAIELIKVYRAQCKEITESDTKASDLLTDIMCNFQDGVMPMDEAILRITCINLKTRGDYMNLWKSIPPLLRQRNQGQAEHFETTAVNSRGEVVPAKGVRKPGYRIVSLNASEKTRKKLKI